MWSKVASSWLLVAALFVPALASAQSTEESAAEVLFREGRAALERHDYPTACEKLERSHELDPATGTLILLGFCHERQGRFASAHREYLAAMALAERAGDRDKAAAARRFAENVRPKRHLLVIVVEADADIELRLDGERLARGRAKHEIALDPGSYTIEAQGAAAPTWLGKVTIPSAPGRTILNVPALGRGDEAERDAAEPRSWWSDHALAVVALGVGAVGVGVGSYFGLRAFSEYDDSEAFCDAAQHCEPRGHELRDDARRSATISNIGFAVGLIGLGTGTVLLVTSSPGADAASGGATATLVGSF